MGRYISPALYLAFGVIMGKRRTPSAATGFRKLGYPFAMGAREGALGESDQLARLGNSPRWGNPIPH